MGIRVLIVDDSPVMRRFILRTLESSGLEIAGYAEASDGAGALRLLKSQAADVILTDINMPGMNGEELLRRLQQDASLRALPVLVVSTDATPSRVRSALTLGARGYVSKPFSPEALRAELQRVLEAVHA